jgi:hypothetical protein
VSDFFARHDRFLTTSRTSPAADRLHARYDAIIAAHRELLAGRRVLDIASHDGRWSFAALDAGAAHVTGVEPRAELVAAAEESCRHYGRDHDQFRFVQADIFDYLADQPERFDVVLCLGFYYHTARHVDLFDLIERTGAAVVVVDTEVVPLGPATPDPTGPRLIHHNPFEIQLLREPAEDEAMAVTTSSTRSGHTIVGRPSRAAVAFIADHFGFDCEELDWPPLVARYPATQAIEDYRTGWRTTFTCRRR